MRKIYVSNVTHIEGLMDKDIRAKCADCADYTHYPHLIKITVQRRHKSHAWPSPLEVFSVKLYDWSHFKITMVMC